MIRRVSHDIGLCVYPLDKSAVLLINSQSLLYSLQIANPCQVHVEVHGDVIFGELPKL
jgi:hypothetical protein